MNRNTRKPEPGDTALGCFILVIFLAALIMLGVGVWAIIELVQWVTSK